MDQPTPRLIGAGWWRGYAGVSAFGVALRLGRLNCLCKAEMQRLGLVGGYFVSWLRNDALFDNTAQQANVPASIRADFPLAPWWPFAGEVPWHIVPWRLRVCPTCLRAGYHSVAFQLPGLEACPWHCEQLRCTCPRCDRVWDSTRLLAGMPCECGQVACDYEQLATGFLDGIDAREGFLDRIKSWAREQRSRRGLLSPASLDRAGWGAMRALIEPFGSFTLTPTPRLRQSVVVLPLDRCDPPLEDLISDAPGLVRLPQDWAPELELVARVATLRADAMAALPAEELPKASQDVPDALSWPVFRGENALIADTGAFDRNLRNDLGHWSAALLGEAPFGLDGWIGGDQEARRVLAAFIRQVFFRTYAESLALAMRRAFPKAASGPAPKLRRAWGVIERFEQCWLGQVAWTVLPGARQRAAQASIRFPTKRLPTLEIDLAHLAQVDGDDAHDMVIRAVQIAMAAPVAPASFPAMPPSYRDSGPEQLELLAAPHRPARANRPAKQLRLPLYLPGLRGLSGRPDLQG